MDEPVSRTWEVFFEVYEALPRQGPGSRACAARALAICRDLPPSPMVLDLGCGVGGQTLYLAELTGGSIVAVDRHEPSVRRLNTALAARGLAQQILALVGDMAHPAFASASFDLIWSEGALYNIGIGQALTICHGLLRPGGYVAFTDAVWRRDDPPGEVKAAFEQDYPTMGHAEDVVAAIRDCGLELLDHFTLPDEAWWSDFYTPMEHRIEILRGKYAADGEALAILDQLAREPDMHRRHSGYYAYEFFVARRPASPEGRGMATPNQDMDRSAGGATPGAR